ncbi:beta-1,3-galactosyl-O-glycosyl-glycoprotein beta-1,6-N-acetylglucosaminyltransferase 3-like [Cynoglossus semilaevis]|uniref:beta-1,3-galactosyl-O-glycosyl-glycoprotein beta-1,6-N-acetylglucosaminyltransferase 3-like n=1 Tax=Cynoglossus semilaevis TaxID=244447 RepID=UPI000D627F65|nr:beta-1,3-galactosyl-O-glycosyl-glycoprotein beta-1,6-N-acetylglucosaminyltransferase 3-like [Cynoglossus semilaevis]
MIQSTHAKMWSVHSEMAALVLGRSTSIFLVRLCLLLAATFLSLVLWEVKSGMNSLHDPVIPVQFSLDLPGCAAIITGDIGDKKKDVETLLVLKKKRKLLSPQFYLNLTQDCPTYIELRGFITTPQSKEEKDFPIAYSIVIHEKIEMFERLLRSIYAPQNVYCVHVDQKSPEEFHKAVAAIVACFPNVFIASKLENVVYASWTRVQADLNCMEDLLKSSVKWKYLLNTCGTDFPIKTNGEIVQALKTLNGRNSMESERTPDFKKPRWQYHHEVTDTIKFIEWEKDTYSPDEHMWATFQRMPSVPGSVPANIKYDTSDLQAQARLVKWDSLTGDVRKGAPYGDCTGAYRRSICVFGTGDLLWLFRQHHLFANKFDPGIDDSVIRCIETVLRHRSLGHDPLASVLSRSL